MTKEEVLKKPLTVKIFGLLLLGIACFYLGRHWSSAYEQVVIVSSASGSVRSPVVTLAPNETRSYDLQALNITKTSQSPPPPPLLPPPPPSFGVIREDGAMQNDFEVGYGENDNDTTTTESELDIFDQPLNGSDSIKWNNESTGGMDTKIHKFEVCPADMREYIPCLDNIDAINKLPSTAKGEKFERHCPDEASRWCCLVPNPPRYRAPIPWPQSRNEVWFSNVPHTRLVEDKGGQNWIVLDKDKFKFPGGGTQFIHGADQYLDQMAQMVPDLAFGVHTRVALDVGCGVASFGAFLLSRNVLTLSIAPKDVHENQIQFALERGVPAMVAAFATHRLLYPSQAFDLIHCSRCRIDWTRDGGILLLEVDRLLRAGGYFAWAAQPVYKHEENLQEAWKDMEDLATSICWKLVKKEGYIAIWQKPSNNSCYVNREMGVQPPLCDVQDDPDDVWYVPLKACITRLPENGFGGNLTEWQERLHTPPDRLQAVEMDAYVAKKEVFNAETGYWNMVVESYLRGLGWKKQKFRNVMDMRAGFGGFSTALLDQHVDSWVMNVVTVTGPNTLPVIYDRGLIGVAHDWCEPFDTYPRTYDLLHASGLFSIEQKRCKIVHIMLEMDRILRPGGYAYIRDSRTVLAKVELLAKAMRWRIHKFDTEEGAYASRSVLACQKQLLHS
eukprot:Gb_07905 [translate_table: standard]